MSKRVFNREAGVLLPITSLPSKYGIGDLGIEAFKFAEFLHEAGQKIWQVLPLTATDPGCGNSPYSPTSAFAGNYLVISPEWLVKNNLLELKDLKDFEALNLDLNKINYDAVIKFKDKIFRLAFKNFNNNNNLLNKFKEFCAAESEWLDGWSAFIAIKAAQGGRPWYDWPEDLKFRKPQALNEFINLNLDEINYQKFLQFIFASQMGELREHLKKLNISLIGDVPVYVTRDCADVWQFPELFDLDEDLNPVTIAGVPPDYFSAKGQLWGNPTYNWNKMRETNFHRWVARLRHLLEFFDFDKVRIDHFRGLVAYWALPADAETAEFGKWLDVPYKEFFAQLEQEFPEMPFWAENLGILTPEVEDLRKDLEMPGMLILQFAFGNPADNPYAPHNNSKINVIYTGTHDNNTTRGWFNKDAGEHEIKNLALYLGLEPEDLDEADAAHNLIRLALSSVANTAIIPMQDYLNLGADARINIPSTPKDNWAWRMTGDFSSGKFKSLALNIKALTQIFGR